MSEIIPAIDLRGGRCVRLIQGDYDRETVYGDDPVSMARHWVVQGARRLHLVDLDGARDGTRANADSIGAIARAVSVPLQVGGGIRTESDAVALLEAGIDRVVLGTAAVEDPGLLTELARRYPHRIALGLDVRNGRVATAGWRELSDLAPRDLLSRYSALPLAAVIYTDIARDGMMSGPNLEALAAVQAATTLPVIASGGIGHPTDIARLREMGVAGMIIGKALYEGGLTLRDAHSMGH